MIYHAKGQEKAIYFLHEVSQYHESMMFDPQS